MAYTKPPVLPAWGETAATPADLEQPTNDFISAGWPNNGVPPDRQTFNWFFSFAAKAIRYFSQRGLVDYDAAETYSLNSRVIGDDGNSYISLQDNNLGHTPSTSPTYWARWGFTLAQINGSQLTQVTPGPGDNSTKVATTAYVLNALVGFATQAWVLAQTFATQAWVAAQGYVTLAAVATWAAGGFATSFGTPGYIKLPNFLGGFVVQWGQTTINGTGTIFFPLAFPNACLSITGNDVGNPNGCHAIGFWSMSTAAVNVRSIDYNGNNITSLVGWIAVGR
jgi:hypothetical protein